MFRNERVVSRARLPRKIVVMELFSRSSEKLKARCVQERAERMPRAQNAVNAKAVLVVDGIVGLFLLM